MDVNLESDMRNDLFLISLLRDREVAFCFYNALCNVTWQKIADLDKEDLIVEKLKGNTRIWSCSWRYAGGIISDIRNKEYNKREDYLSYYCSGHEGTVTELVEDCFKRLGWVRYEEKD